jgi:hypothetical protein
MVTSEASDDRAQLAALRQRRQKLERVGSASRKPSRELFCLLHDIGVRTRRTRDKLKELSATVNRLDGAWQAEQDRGNTALLANMRDQYSSKGLIEAVRRTMVPHGASICGVSQVAPHPTGLKPIRTSLSATRPASAVRQEARDVDAHRACSLDDLVRV